MKKLFDENGKYIPTFNEEEKTSDEVIEDLLEEVSVKSIIDEVIDTNWSKDNESQMKVLQLLKGVATSDEKIANDFMKKLDAFTSSLKKDDFKV